MLTLPAHYGPLSAADIHWLFELTAFAVGGQLYHHERRRCGAPAALHGAQFWILVGCLLGAAVGNKLVYLLSDPQLWAEHWHDPQAWWGGQSIVGGLLGGLLGVELAKAVTGQRHSTGDLFVTPLLVAIGVGRIGCFLAGLADATYGNVTALPWGIDFGDGLPRHPTQLYEILFCAGLGGVLAHYRQPLAAWPGLRFKLMLSAYLLWRLLIDGIKPLPAYWPGGLSGIQLVCAIALVGYLPLLIRQLRSPPA